MQDGAPKSIRINLERLISLALAFPPPCPPKEEALADTVRMANPGFGIIFAIPWILRKFYQGRLRGRAKGMGKTRQPARGIEFPIARRRADETPKLSEIHLNRFDRSFPLIIIRGRLQKQ